MLNLLLTYGASLWPQKGTKGVVASEWNLPWSLWVVTSLSLPTLSCLRRLRAALLTHRGAAVLPAFWNSGLESGRPQREWSGELLLFNSFWLTETVCRGAFSPPSGSGDSVLKFLYFVKTLGVMGLFRLWSHWKGQRSTHLLTLMFDCVCRGLPSCPADSRIVRQDSTVLSPWGGGASLILSSPGGPHT